MLIKKAPDVRESEVTPERWYVQAARVPGRGGVHGGGGGDRWAGARVHRHADGPRAEPQCAEADRPAKSPLSTTDEKLNSYRDVTTYNNFYEFGTDKGDPARYAGTLKTRPWSVVVEGQCAKPGTYNIEDIMKWFPLEERIYRMRCVEAWSMVIPWVGFPLADFVKRFEPTSKANYVQFTTLLDLRQMPGQTEPVLDWPYVEGLRMDEAMHPLAIMAVGLYGEVLPNQNGAPIRLVAPWKYGFKGIKSIVRVTFEEHQPRNTWQDAARVEYGFFANVNPAVDHPRWSQASASAASASSSAARRCRSTATPTRWRLSTPAWIFGSSTEGCSVRLVAGPARSE